MSMVITKTPFRISFFGGGTDITDWFLNNDGQVLSAAIDKYCYVTVRHLPPYFEYSIRVSYSKVETVNDLNQIQHPLVREVLRTYKKNNIEVHYDADLPGQSGLGTSSAFAVGLLNAIESMEGRYLPKTHLAMKAISLERDLLKESGGWQDQIAVAFGGLNNLKFFKNSTFSVHPVTVSQCVALNFTSALALVHVPISRKSGEVSLAPEVHNKSFDAQLSFFNDSVQQGIKLLKTNNIQAFGALLHECWVRKRTITNVTNDTVDSIYEMGIKNGAIGGKLLGAGRGGYILFVLEQNDIDAFRKKMTPYHVVPVRFDYEGSQVIYFSN